MLDENGLRLPSVVCKPLAAERMVDGVHFSFFMINTGVLFFVLTAFKAYWWIAAYYITHKILGFLGKKDPIILKLYVRYSQQPVRYQAWPSANHRLGKRPYGYGSGSIR